MPHSKVAIHADDDEFFRIALGGVLRERFGFVEVVGVGTLDEALDELARRGRVGLALFDLSMPGMDGPGSLRAVREARPDTLCAVVSASTRRADVLRALEAGAHGYVPKGGGVAALSAAIGTILSGGIHVPPFVADLSRESSETRGASPPGAFTPRQTEVLGLIAKGMSNREIAREIGLGEGTVKIHVSALLRNLGVPTRAAAAPFAARYAAGAIRG